MSSYADDERDGDFVRCDVAGCTTPDARMTQAVDYTLVAPAGWQVTKAQVRDGGVLFMLVAHVCPSCVSRPLAVVTITGGRALTDP